jgi:hypothetical protein
MNSHCQKSLGVQSCAGTGTETYTGSDAKPSTVTDDISLAPVKKFMLVKFFAMFSKTALRMYLIVLSDDSKSSAKAVWLGTILRVLNFHRVYLAMANSKQVPKSNFVFTQPNHNFSLS